MQDTLQTADLGGSGRKEAQAKVRGAGQEPTAVMEGRRTAARAPARSAANP